ncbi:MAG: glutamyl-tRNA reductase [Deltaproteobacteria bacterium]|nr:MAG: glutamyl-tRNA reductase [Deltaproteobacteria bacterium]
MREVILVGLNHRTAPLEIREKVSFHEGDLDRYLKALQDLPSVVEGLILSTCNRVEVYAATRDSERGVDEIKSFLAHQHHLPLSEFEDTLYIFQGEEVVRHIFRVASSLDSMVVGEPQILGQLKSAYRVAHATRATGTLLNRLLHRTFSVAKRVRTETRIGNRAVSVSFVAVELAKKIFGHLEGRDVLIIGAGEMCELAAQHLRRGGTNRVLVTNRTWERAMELAERFHGEAIPFTEFTNSLLRVDIVISSTGSPDYILRKEDISKIIKERRNRPLFFIDIAVPRDIDPQVNSIDNVYLYDIDDLQEVAEANIKDRQQEAQRAEEIVATEVTKFCRWYQSLDVVPTIVSLREKLEEIRKKELERTLSSLPRLSEKERKALDALTAAIVKKILHGPVTLLKETSQDSEGDLYVDVVKKLFRLDEE